MNRSPHGSITYYATANGTAHLVPVLHTPLAYVVTFDREDRLMDYSKLMPLPEAEHYARSLKV